MTEFDPREKLLRHPLTLAAFVRDDWKAPPIGVEISPTNSCNARCDWCFYVAGEYKQKHSKDELPFDVLENTIFELSNMWVKSLTWTGGGDPSVYSHIDEAINIASQSGIRQGMFTNGYKPIKKPEKLDWIRITVTEKYTITKHVAEYATKTKVGVNFNLCRENADKLIAMVEAAKAAGVQYFQVRPALADRADLQVPIELPSRLLDYQTDTFRIVLTPYKWEDYTQPHGYPICHGHRIVPFIWHNGDVSTCAYHFGKEPFVFGNLLQNSFREIWESDRRRSIINVPVIHECQHCCKLHEVNKTLATMRRERSAVADEDFL